MSESIVLDHEDIAEDRVALDLHDGPYMVKPEGPEWGDAVIQAYMAEGTRGSAPVDFRLPNREAKIGLMVDPNWDNAGGGKTFKEARAELQAKIGLFQEEGGYLTRIFDDGSQLHLEIVNATLKMGGGTSQAIHDFDPDIEITLECIPDFFGDEVEVDLPTNLVTNPSFEVDTAGWGVYQNATTGTIARSTDVGGHSGAAACKLTCTGGGTGQLGVASSAPTMPVEPGESYTASGWIRAATNARSASMIIGWYTSGGSLISTHTGPAVTATVGDWVRASYTAVAPPTAAFATVYLQAVNPATSDIFYIDALMLTEGALIDYFDGDSSGADWSSTPHASRSQKRTMTDILGDYSGRLRIEATDNSGNDQLGLFYGLRARHYSADDTAALAIEAEALTPLDAAAVESFSGASGGSVVRHANLSTNWTPVLSLDPLAGGHLTHEGTYRVFARAYSISGVLAQARLLWDTGDLSAPVENDPWTFPAANNFYIADFGEVRLDPSPVGDHHWTGHIQARGFVGGESIRIDKLWFIPVDEAAGVLRAPRNTPSFTHYLARDGFNQSAGALNAKALAAASSVSTKYPGTAASDSGYGTAVWGAAPYAAYPPSKIGAADSDPTIAADTGAGYATSQYLKATNFGFALPAGATVDGIVVSIRRCNSSSDYQRDYTTDARVRLVKGGTVQATDKADLVTKWPQSPSYGWKYYGSPTDKWGTTWTEAEVEASNFGVVLSAYMRDAAALVDAIAVTIYYTDAAGQTWTTTGDADDFAVEATGHTAQRTIATADADINTGRYAIAGSTVYTDGLVGVDLKRTVLTAGAAARFGALARYVDTNNYLFAGFDFRSTDTTANRIAVYKRVAGTVTEIMAVTTESYPVTDNYVSVWLDVDSGGRFAVYVFMRGSVPKLVASGYDADLATGGTLDDGKVGFYEAKLGATASTRTFDDFFIASPIHDAVAFAGQSVEIRDDGVYRADAPGGSYGPVPLLEGDNPRLPPSRLEDRVIELIVKMSRGDMDVMPDPAIDDFSVRAYYRPSWLFVTGEAQPGS